jgi:hypothetical protein
MASSAWQGNRMNNNVIQTQGFEARRWAFAIPCTHTLPVFLGNLSATPYQAIPRFEAVFLHALHRLVASGI